MHSLTLSAEHRRWRCVSAKVGLYSGRIDEDFLNGFDDDGDGLITSRDIPDLVFSSQARGLASGGWLRVLSGDGAGEHFSFDDAQDAAGNALRLSGEGGVAVGDIDGDGLVDAADLGLLVVGWGPCP